MDFPKLSALETNSAFYSAVDGLSVGVNVCDQEERIIYCNEALARITGYSREEMIGKTTYELFIPPEQVEWLKAKIKHRFEGVAERYELPINRKDNSRVWVNVSAAPIMDEDGTVIGSIAIAEDITERKLAIEALARSEQRYRNLVETVSDLIWSVDSLGRWTFVNQACFRILGYTPEEMLGRPFTDFQRPEVSEQDLAVFSEILQGKSYFNYVTEHIRKDGTPVMLRFNAITLRDSAGNVIGTTGTATDITEQLRIEHESLMLQKQLQQSQKMEAIGQLASGIAHDLNNALAAVVGHLHLLQISSKLDEAAAQSVQVALAGCNRAGSLTNQLLGFSRQGKYNPQPLLVAALMHDTLRFLEPIIAKDIRIESSITNQDLVVLGDAAQLQQVLTNLIINATQAMPNGGLIQMTCVEVNISHSQIPNPHAEAGKFAVIRVQDSGTGIKPEHLDKIFEPFFTTRGNGKSSGLGLAMAYGIIHNHGGWIEVSSEVGKGSIFSVFLPRTDLAPATLDQPKISSQRNIDGHVLVIDDEPLLVDLTKRLFESHGFTCSGFVSGSEAIKWYQQNWKEVSCIVLDMKMPQIAGTACFRALREINPSAKIVLFTGYTEDEEAHALLELGALRVFQKPLKYEELVAWISHNISSSNADGAD